MTPVSSPSKKYSPSNSSPYSPNQNTIYSDRFIPSRLSSNLDEAFDLIDSSQVEANQISHSNYYIFDC